MVLVIIIVSCQSNSNFKQSNKFYKADINNRETHISFIDDTIIAINTDSLKTCSWYFMPFKQSKNALYQTNEFSSDTIWFKAEGKNIIMSEPNNTIIFGEVKFAESEVDLMNKDLEISRDLYSKGVVYECDYTVEEVDYFYEKAIEKVKNNLKTSSSASFNKTQVQKYRSFTKDNKYKKTTTTFVSIDTESKNNSGDIAENKYYVFFIPKKNDKNNYDIELSDNPVLNPALGEKLEFE